jgi:hypothetical protein
MVCYQSLQKHLKSLSLYYIHCLRLVFTACSRKWCLAWSQGKKRSWAALFRHLPLKLLLPSYLWSCVEETSSKSFPLENLHGDLTTYLHFITHSTFHKLRPFDVPWQQCNKLLQPLEDLRVSHTVNTIKSARIQSLYQLLIWSRWMCSGGGPAFCWHLLSVCDTTSSGCCSASCHLLFTINDYLNS